MSKINSRRKVVAGMFQERARRLRVGWRLARQFWGQGFALEAARIASICDPTPSQADIQMTKAIVQIATPLGISVHDHIIVGKNGHASLKGLKLI
jgi:hypothetical protein